VTQLPVYGHFGRRVLAFILDVAVLFGISLVLSVLIRAASNDPQAAGWVPIGVLLCFWIYKAGFESSTRQASLGKRALGLKVTTENGERIGFGRATARFFAQIFSYMFLGIGYFMAAFTPRRQALHDYIAGTLVTRRDATPEEIKASDPSRGTSGLVIAVVVCFVMIAVIGMLAAISIPAYHNYTIRAQVTDALTHADAYKTAVAEAFASGTEADAINNAPGGIITLTTTGGGRYTDSVQVTNGTVLITFGGQANQHLAGRKLALWPVVTEGNGTTVWVCGHGAPPAGVGGSSIEAALRLTDVPDQYLPTSCHT
jgi:uncharacterized RDD family membrane protein YckC/Tfp pilus assembly major pilin PilA